MATNHRHMQAAGRRGYVRPVLEARAVLAGIAAAALSGTDDAS